MHVLTFTWCKFTYLILRQLRISSRLKCSAKCRQACWAFWCLTSISCCLASTSSIEFNWLSLNEDWRFGVNPNWALPRRDPGVKKSLNPKLKSSKLIRPSPRKKLKIANDNTITIDLTIFCYYHHGPNRQRSCPRLHRICQTRNKGPGTHRDR